MCHQCQCCHRHSEIKRDEFLWSASAFWRKQLQHLHRGPRTSHRALCKDPSQHWTRPERSGSFRVYQSTGWMLVVIGDPICFLRFVIVYATLLFDNLSFVTSVSCFYKDMSQLSCNWLRVCLWALLETWPICGTNLDTMHAKLTFTPG